MSAQVEIDPRVRAAAERAVREDGALAVILFGSRASGQARPGSDIDLAVIGDGEPRKARRKLYRRLCEHFDLDVLARDLQDLRENAYAGTAWGDIVRQGRTIAGEIKELKEIEVVPITRRDLAMKLAGGCTSAAARCIGAATAVYRAETEAEAAHAQDDEEALENLELVRYNKTKEAAPDSVYLAEHTVLALATIVEARKSGHDLNDAAEKLRLKAVQLGLTGRAEKAEHVQALVPAVRDLNGNSADAHNAPYMEPPPLHETITRLSRATALQTDTLRGLIKGDGPPLVAHRSRKGKTPQNTETEKELAKMRRLARAGARSIAEDGRRAIEEIDKLTQTTEVASLREICARWTEEGRKLHTGGLEDRAEEAITTLNACRKHVSPLTRAQAIVHLSSFRSDPEKAQHWLGQAILNDREIRENTDAAKLLNERITLIGREGKVIGQAEAIAAASPASAPRPNPSAALFADMHFASTHYEFSPEGREQMKKALLKERQTTKREND